MEWEVLCSQKNYQLLNKILIPATIGNPIVAGYLNR